MKNRIILILSIVMPFYVACSKEDTLNMSDLERQQAEERSGPALVRGANGETYSLACVGNKIDQISKMTMDQAKAEVETCNARKMSSTERSRAHHSSGYAYVYYPQYYYSGSNNSFWGNAFNYHGYGYGYNWGGNSTFNWWGVFGYDTSNYGSNYDTGCASSCWTYSGRPRRCVKNNCWGNYYW